MSITRPIAEHARRLPKQQALVFESRVITRQELDAIIARLAAFLAGKTLREGTVILDLPNGPALAVLFLATAAAGRNALLFDADWPDDMVNALLEKHKPALIISSRASLGDMALRLGRDEDAADIADALGAPVDFRRVPEPAGEMIFYTGFTSGSGGAPKGFSRTHRSWLASFSGVQEEFDLGPADIVFAPGPLSHSLPLYALASALHAGARFVLTRGFQARAAVRTAYAQRATIIFCVPSQLLLMLDAAEADDQALHSVRLILCSGSKWPEKMSARIRKAFPNAIFAEFYGASELSFVTLARSDEPVPEGSVGRAFPGVSISIRTATGKSAGAGRPGLVFVESPLVFSRYTDSRNEIRTCGNALSVGDRGYLDKAGFLFLTGRADRLIISSGRNIQPEEIEVALERHPFVEAACVFGVEDERRGARLVAVLMRAEGAELDSAILTQHLRAALAPYKVPTRFGVVTHWPRNRAGKTDAKALARLWGEGAYELLP